jgi:TetR/AcrR family transcriptional regulator, transcriptional repressor for nem operon
MVKGNLHVKENLLEVGTTLFCEHGYHGTGIQEIVDAMGVPKGSFYNYFKSKEDFAAEIVKHYADHVSEVWKLLIARGPDDDPFKMLRNVFESMVQGQDACRVKTGCLIGNLAGELAESSEICRVTLKSVMVNWCDRVAYHLERAQVQGTVRRDIQAVELAQFCWDAWEGSLLRMKIENSTEPIRHCVSLLFDVFLKPQ